MVTQVKAEANSTGGVDLTDRWQEYMTVSLVKIWEDTGKESLRPDSITLQVNGLVSDETLSQTTVTLTAAEGWKKDVLSLPRWYYA